MNHVLQLALKARAARRIVEAALAANGWGWNVGLSRWLDVLITLEEGARQ